MFLSTCPVLFVSSDLRPTLNHSLLTWLFMGATQNDNEKQSTDSPCDRRALVKGFAAGVLGTAVVAGTGSGFQVLPGIDATAALAAEIGTKESPIAVVGAGGERAEERGLMPMIIVHGSVSSVM